MRVYARHQNMHPMQLWPLGNQQHTDHRNITKLNIAKKDPHLYTTHMRARERERAMTMACWSAGAHASCTWKIIIYIYSRPQCNEFCAVVSQEYWNSTQYNYGVCVSSACTACNNRRKLFIFLLFFYFLNEIVHVCVCDVCDVYLFLLFAATDWRRKKMQRKIHFDMHLNRSCIGRPTGFGLSGQI